MTTGHPQHASAAPALSPAERRLAIIAAILLVLAVALPAIPQDQAYHRFADTRPLVGLSNAMDVLSNVPFLLFGALGLVWHWLDRIAYGSRAMRRAGGVFFAGLLLTAFGSGYYHVAPNDAGLAWDRLGMVVAFAGVLGLAAAHRVSGRAADVVLPVALVAGTLSVLWFATTGSLTPYAVLQFGGIGMIAALAWLPAHGRGPNWAALIALYALAKVLEMADGTIFELTRGLVSGHTLKHVFAALTALAVLLPLARSSATTTPQRAH